MSDETPRTPLTASEQAEAERLLKTLLADRSDLSMPTLWSLASHGNLGHVYTDLCTLIFRAHQDGWDEGYFDGRADAREDNDEPDYGDGG